MDLDLNLTAFSVFLRCFRDPIRVLRISTRVPRIRENYHGSLESEKLGP